MDARSQPTAVFVADAHFHLDPDAAERQRLQHFLELLDLCRKADHLVLLGDIFDFWFDYPHFRLQGYEALLQGLDAVKAAGTTIHFVGGNHDIWAARYLQDRYGCSGRGEPRTLVLGQTRIRLEHGDGLLGFEGPYRLFRFLVRAKPLIVLAKSLHPELLFALSTWLSGRSRRATRDEAARIEQKARAWLPGRDREPWDLMLIGHLHHRFEACAGGKRLAALGGWLGPLDYAVLKEGTLHLLDFLRDPRPEL